VHPPRPRPTDRPGRTPGSRPGRRRRLVGAAAVLTALVVVPTVAVTARDVVAASVHAAAVHGGSAAIEVRIAAERLAELRHPPDQVLTGALGPSTPGAVTFAYAGDSITARPGSWLRDLSTDPTVHAVGGYAHSGYRSDQVAALMPAVPGADVLVVELGTNDVNQGVPVARITEHIDALVAEVGAPHVLLVAAPPSDHTTSLWGVDRRAGNAVLDRALVADAARHGWSSVDPFAADRTADGAWAPGTTVDGIHPTPAVDAVIAPRFAAAIAAAARVGSSTSGAGSDAVAAATGVTPTHS
jgi:lysophospholipase L1-like esterase